MQTRNENQIRRKRSPATIAIILAVVLVTVTLIGGTYARYVYEKNTATNASASEFKFQSDYLKEDNSTPYYHVYGDTVAITLQNNDGLNYTNVDITYEVSLTTDETGTTPMADDKFSVAGNGSLKGGELTSVTLSLKRLADVKKVTVNVAASAPYTKTLKATFEFHDPSESNYSITEEDTYVEVNLYTGAGIPTGGIKISHTGADLVADKTNANIDFKSSNVDTTVLTGLVPQAHYQFIFFKTGAEDTNLYTDTEGQLPLPTAVDNVSTISIS